VFCLALPAILPTVALVIWIFHRPERQWAAKNGIPYLLTCTVVYVASTYPRADVAHLAFVAALPAALTAVWIARYASRLSAVFVVGFLAAGASVLVAGSWDRATVAVTTPAGKLQAASADAQAMAALVEEVRPQDSLYVHPYNPMLYFLTQARNPTRYSHLVPGMMTHDDEAVVLDGLRRSPPAWVLYLNLSRAEFLRVFPHAGTLDHRFPAIEQWLACHYVPVEPSVVVAGYRLYRAVGQASPCGGL
jgi:hypothetical protein